jgi:hypothetical protein
MLFTSVFMVVLIAALVTVSQVTTLSKRIVRKSNDDSVNRPSQRILDVVAGMSPADRATLFPAMSAAPTNVTQKESDVRTSRNLIKVPISA